MCLYAKVLNNTSHVMGDVVVTLEQGKNSIARFENVFAIFGKGMSKGPMYVVGLNMKCYHRIAMKRPEVPLESEKFSFKMKE